VSRVFRIGGAQAVASLAYGTETVPRVDKVVGPGNIYVALAKKLLYGIVDIDMIAGPSEILVIADESARPEWVLAEKVRKCLEDMLSSLPKREIARRSLNRFGTIFITEDLYHACEVANLLAPEHLEIMTRDPWSLLPLIKHAGAVFLGNHTTEPLGDYILGPNHTLPTGGSARFFSPLGVYDFVKRSSLLYVSKDGFLRLCDLAESIARAEDLSAHALALRVRKEE